MHLTEDDWQTLTRDSIRAEIATHITDDPATFAIRHSSNHFPYAVVSTQLKYLQRARQKLPSWYAVQAVIPPLAYEQCSSELAASQKPFRGARALDLTMGLGVDSHYLAQVCDEVVAVEAQSVLANIVRYNYRLLGQEKVTIHNQTAEEFLTAYDGEAFDLIYADPARRNEKGQRVYDLAQTHPNLVMLWPHLQRVGRRLLVKASPLLDLLVAPTLLPGVQKLYVQSIQQEVKEILLEIDLTSQAHADPKDVELVILLSTPGKRSSFLMKDWAQSRDVPSTPASPSYLVEPDPAFYKSRTLPHLLEQHLGSWAAGLTHPMGYCLSEHVPPNVFPGRTFILKDIFPYKPKVLKKALIARKLQRIHVLRRQFPLTVKQIRQQLRLQEGEEAYLICTTWQGKKTAFLAERMGRGDS